MGIKKGGDPRALPEYQTLRRELAKLGHPACPDVDWQTIESCCLAVFASNGADLQTAATYALACSHLAGLDGMSEGVAVLETLLRADANPWPRGVSARAEILGRLFGHWQAVLRGMKMSTCDSAGLGRLNVQLEQLRLTLSGQNPVPITALEGLRQQISQRARLIERDAQALALAAETGEQRLSSPPPWLPSSPSPLPCPSRIAAPTPPTLLHNRSYSKKRRGIWIGLLVATLFSMIAALAWQ